MFCVFVYTFCFTDFCVTYLNFGGKNVLHVNAKIMYAVSELLYVVIMWENEKNVLLPATFKTHVWWHFWGNFCGNVLKVNF